MDTVHNKSSTIESSFKVVNKQDNDDKQQQQQQQEQENHEVEKNKYLFREKCFVCKKMNPNPLDISSSSSSSTPPSTPDCSDCSDNETTRKKNKNKKNNIFLNNNTFKKLTKLPLWMCNECKIRCKEEEENKLIYEKVRKMRGFFAG